MAILALLLRTVVATAYFEGADVLNGRAFSFSVYTFRISKDGAVARIRSPRTNVKGNVDIPTSFKTLRFYYVNISNNMPQNYDLCFNIYMSIKVKSIP